MMCNRKLLYILPQCISGQVKCKTSSTSASSAIVISSSSHFYCVVYTVVVIINICFCRKLQMVLELCYSFLNVQMLSRTLQDKHSNTFKIVHCKFWNRQIFKCFPSILSIRLQLIKPKTF